MRLLKVILLGNAIMSLTACYFDSNSSYFKLPQAVYCPKEKKTNIEKYYKNVSDEQKMSDIKECLGDDYEYGKIPDKNGSIFQRLREKYPNSNDDWEKIRAFDNCMKNNKGYLFQD